MGRIGLVLEGGGMRGLYTAGVMDVFMEHNFLPQVICGTSAGVTFGVNLPSGQRGRVLRYNLKYLGKKEYISLHSLLTTGNMINVPFAYGRLPFELDPFDEAAYEASGVEYYATVTNVRTGQAEYIRLENCERQMDVIRASASLPFVSRKVWLDGVPYLDGGIVDNIPLKKCLECGCDKIVVVLTHPDGYVRNEHYSLMARLCYPFHRQFIRALDTRNDRYNSYMEKILKLEAEGRIYVIRPSRNVQVGRLESDPSRIQAVYDLGVEDAGSLWTDLENYLGESLPTR